VAAMEAQRTSWPKLKLSSGLQTLETQRETQRQTLTDLKNRLVWRSK
jgi:hypothetical protein